MRFLCLATCLSFFACATGTFIPTESELDSMTQGEIIESLRTVYEIGSRESQREYRARARARLLDMSPLAREWSRHHRSLIAKGEIELGMTKRQVQFAKGYPSKVNRTRTLTGEQVQWVYRYRFDYHFVYFAGETVTSIQD